MTANPNTYTKAQKAAIVLLSLEDSLASSILRNLDEDDLRRLAKAAETLDRFTFDDAVPAFEEFDERMKAPALTVKHGGNHVRLLTAAAIGHDRAERLFSPPPVVSTLDALRGARAETLADLLAEEHPQIAAVIVSQLPSDRAAKIIKAMPEEVQADLAARIAQLEEVSVDALTAASEAVLAAVSAAGGLTKADSVSRFDGVAFIASIMNELPNEHSDSLLANMGDAANKVREAMFTFEDLAKLDKRSLQALLREVSGDQLAIALKSASDALREKIFMSMSQRAAENLREELDLMAPKRISEVEVAQREVIETALRLGASNQITLPSRGAEKLV